MKKDRTIASVFVLCLTLMVGISVYARITNQNIKKQYLTQGYKVKAVVVKKYVSEIVNKSLKTIKTYSTDYQLHLKYKIDTSNVWVEVISNEYLTESIYNKISVGDTLNIYILNTDPQSPLLEEVILEE